MLIPPGIASVRLHRPGPDRLDVHEFADAVNAKFAAIAGSLDAAEWQARIGRDHSVDEHGAGVDLPCVNRGLDEVTGPYRSTQPALSLGGAGDGFLGGFDPDDRGNRAEGLFPKSRHLWRDMIEHGR